MKKIILSVTAVALLFSVNAFGQSNSSNEPVADFEISEEYKNKPSANSEEQKNVIPPNSYSTGKRPVSGNDAEPKPHNPKPAGKKSVHHNTHHNRDYSPHHYHESSPEIIIVAPAAPVQKNLNSYSSVLTVNCNAPDALVYVDGVFKGNAPLNISNLSVGKHYITLKKEHYETKIFPVTILKGKNEILNGELQKLSGVLNIISDTPIKNITIDGVKTSGNNFELNEGTHHIVINEFGYDSIEKEILIQKDTVSELELQMMPSVLKINEIYPSRNSINPNGFGSAKKIDFRISVTGPGSAKINILNSADEIVYSGTMTFYTWDNVFTWDGKDMRGKTVKKGAYTFKASTAKGEAVTKKFFVDNSISFQNLSAGNNGFGIGNIPVAYSNPDNSLYLGISTQINSSNLSLDSTPITISGIISSKDNFEVGADISWDPLNSRFEHLLVNGKAFLNFEIFPDVNYALGITSRLAYTTIDSFNAHLFDTGKGFALGLMTGFNSNHFSVNAASQFIAAPVSGFDYVYMIFNNYSPSEYMWKNSIAVQFQKSALSIAAYGSLSSILGSAIIDNSETDISNPLAVIDAGLEFTAYLGGTGTSLNLRGGNYILNLEQSVPYFYAGIGYVF